MLAFHHIFLCQNVETRSGPQIIDTCQDQEQTMSPHGPMEMRTI